MKFFRERLRKHHISFIHAYEGIRWAFSTQPNFTVHVTLSAIAVAGGVFFQISPTEWMIITATIVFGLVCEMINTSLESVTDLVTQEWRLKAKVAKDVAAGMMLIYAVGALLIATIIFLPKIIALIYTSRI